MTELTQEVMRERSRIALSQAGGFERYNTSNYYALISTDRSEWSPKDRKYLYDLKDVEIQVTKGACHASLFSSPIREASTKDIKFLATNCSEGLNINEDMARKFFSWVSDPEISPWRHAFEGKYEVVEEKGSLKGVIFDPETLAKYPDFFYWFNVCSVLRQAGADGSTRLPIWNILTENGVDPSVALIVSERFIFSQGKVQRGDPNSNHRPTWDNTSFVRMNNADWTKEVKHQSELFKGKENVKFFTVAEVYKKGRYASYSEIPLDDLLKAIEEAIK